MLKFILKLFISSVPIIILYFIWKSILWNDVKITWFISYYYLILVLLISPISYIFYKFNLLKKYSNLVVSFRRPVWILTWIMALTHWFKFDERVYSMWEKYYSEKTTFLNFIYDGIFNGATWTILWMNSYSFWFWFVWIVIMLILLSTSNNFSQKLLWAKVWKYIQRLIYPLFIIIVLHIFFVWWWKWIYMYPAIILVLSRLYVFFDKNFEYKWSTHDTISWYRKFLCLTCWFIYDEELWDPDWWLAPWTKFEQIPEDWKCPVCWVTKKDFTPLDGNYNPEHVENHELDFELKSKKYLTKDVLELGFYCENKLEILPGQFCNLIFNYDDKENKITRSYSVLKYIDNYVYFWIKLKPNWKWSEAMKILEEWSKIKALWPFWGFVLQNTSKKKIFIATWTWLSPIYNMIEKSWNIPKELYFWLQKESDLFYLDELNKIPNLKIHIYISREENTNFNYWRIDYDKLNIENNSEIYMCWSPWLLEAFTKQLEKAWIQNVYYEKFL
jgi:NAD(P)H-flavin reductase/rubredoxin/DMSO/TMAO reductase YedYZ heme-binding membrane subunit